MKTIITIVLMVVLYGVVESSDYCYTPPEYPYRLKAINIINCVNKIEYFNTTEDANKYIKNKTRAFRVFEMKELEVETKTIPKTVTVETTIRENVIKGVKD